MTSVIQNLHTSADGIVSFAWTDDGRQYGTGTDNGWQKPWGGVGQASGEPMSLRAAMALSRADFSTSVRRAYAPSLRLRDAASAEERRQMPAGIAMIPVPGMRHIVRDDTDRVLGTVSRTYPHIPYVQAMARFLGVKFDPTTGAMDETGAPFKVDTMGVLGNGEQMYATIQLPGGPRKIGSAGAVARYMLIHLGHDGHTTMSARLTAISVVCANTLTAAMRDTSAGRVSVRHKRSRAHTDERLITAADEMRRMIGIADAQDAQYAKMAERTLSERESLAVLAALYGNGRDDNGHVKLSTRGEEHVRDIVSLFERTDGTDGNGRATGVTRAHTAWDLLQAGTFHLDNVAPPKRTADESIDAGEVYSGPVDSWMHREVTDSLVSYRQRLTDILVDVSNGADALAMVGASEVLS